MSRQRTMAPSRTPSAEILISRMSGSLRRSTSSVGAASRNASIGIRLWPPAIAFASSRDARSATASDSVVGQAYSSGGNFIDIIFRLEPYGERQLPQLTMDHLLGQRWCAVPQAPQRPCDGQSILRPAEILQVRGPLALLRGHDGAVGAQVIDLLADGDPGLAFRAIVLGPPYVGDPPEGLYHRPRPRQRAVGRGHLDAKNVWVFLVERHPLRDDGVVLVAHGHAGLVPHPRPAP